MQPADEYDAVLDSVAKLQRDAAEMRHQNNELNEVNRRQQADIAALRGQLNEEKAAHTITLERLRQSKIEYLKKLVEMEPSNVNILYTWIELGDLLRSDEAIDVREGTTVYLQCTRRDCYLRALCWNPEDSLALNKLGDILGDSEVEANGNLYTKRSCYLKAAENDDYNPWARYSLGFMLPAHERITIKRVEKTKKDLFVDALNINAGMKHWWRHLADAMNPQDTVIINDNRYTKDECLRQAG